MSNPASIPFKDHPVHPFTITIQGPAAHPYLGHHVAAGDSVVEVFPGLSMRDYFIAHAPSEPQPWFSPVLPPAETPLPRFVDMYSDVTDEERSALNHYDPDYMSVEDVKEVRVRNYLFQKEHQNNRKRAYTAMAERERWVQWPAAWADAILKARSA